MRFLNLCLSMVLFACSQPIQQPTDAGADVQVSDTTDVVTVDSQLDTADVQAVDMYDVIEDVVCTEGTVPRLCGGRCVDIFNDPNNCGVCGNVCPTNNCTCISGGCLIPDASFPQVCM